MIPEKLFIKAFQDFKVQLKHIRRDVNLLKGILLPDQLLSKDERKHLNETVRLLKQGKTEDFVKLI